MTTVNALKIYALIKSGKIKSNAQFWREFSQSKLDELQFDLTKYKEELEKSNFDLVCAYDTNFPDLKVKLKPSEKPILFAYKGDINLIKNIDNNVAIIGCTSPNQNVIDREQAVVLALLNCGKTIVSGLAKGCDSVAHNCCVKNNGKTIAILPSTLQNVYPKENMPLMQRILVDGGLVLTEYVKEAADKYENIKRFIDRDRLQALLSTTVILVASYRKGEGDCGSRHAMNKAKEYGRTRYVMFNELTDKEEKIFGLNQDFVNEGVKVLTSKNISC